MATKKKPRRLASKISTRINDKRSEHGWSYREFAKRLGAPVGSVFLWCNGDSEPHMNTLRRIADVFECEISDLVDGTFATAKAS